jgi:hypothetical protein
MADAANPFAAAEAWETSTDTYLPAGNFKVKIELAEDESRKNGKPTIKLQFGNDQGTKGDFCPYDEGFLDRVAALFDCAGLERPKEGEFDPGDHCRLTKACIDRLIGAEIGIVIRPEEYNGKVNDRVKGYVKADQISDVQPYIAPADGGGGGDAAADDPVPF